MLSPEYNAYLKNIVELTRSLLIKDRYTAENQNNFILATGNEVLDNPLTWKYYLNISGHYHVTDKPIKIISSDDRTEITIDADIWLLHPISKIEYGPRGVYHKDLLKQYPNDKELILRMFNPVDIQTAIDAEYYTILWYDDFYIHPREISLMRRLQEWLLSYIARWDIEAMSITDNLYPASHLAMMFLAIPLEIINIRLGLTGTEEVSEFHLWSFLGSRYRLDKYQNFLTNKQAMYLYRNIDYLRWHVGKEATMIDILENITIPVNIAAFKHHVVRAESDLLLTRKTSPLVSVSDYIGDKTTNDILTLDTTYNLTGPVATYNYDDIVEDLEKDTKLMQSQAYNLIPTGLVDLKTSSDIIASVGNKEIGTAHHWLQLTKLNLYHAVFDINLGTLGSITLQAKDAALLFTYAYNILNGGSNTDAPVTVRFDNVVRFTQPTLLEIEAILPDYLVIEGYAQAVFDILVPLRVVNDVGELSGFMDDVINMYFKLYLLYRTPNGADSKSFLKNIHELIFTRVDYDFNANGYVDYQEWLDVIDFPDVALSESDLLETIQSVLAETTGLNLASALTPGQSASIEILKLLTSYGIIFISSNQSINVLPLEVWDIEPIFDILTKEVTYELFIGFYGIESWGGSTSSTNMPLLPIDLIADTVIYYYIDLDMGLTTEVNTLMPIERYIDMPGISITETTVNTI